MQVVRTTFRQGARSAQKAAAAVHAVHKQSAGSSSSEDMGEMITTEGNQEVLPEAFTHPFAPVEEATAVTAMLVESFSRRRKDREDHAVSCCYG